MKKMSNFDQKKYIQEWKKNHKRACVQFVKNAIVALKENLNEENKK